MKVAESLELGLAGALTIVVSGGGAVDVFDREGVFGGCRVLVAGLVGGPDLEDVRAVGKQEIGFARARTELDSFRIELAAEARAGLA